MNTLYDTEFFVPAATPAAMCDQVCEALSRVGVRIDKAFCSVAPRYTCGSPAMISMFEAVRVAIQEIDAHKMALTGVMGDKDKKKAETAGLDNIAYARWEKGNKVWRYDFITGKTFVEPPRLTWNERERVRILRGFVVHFARAEQEMRPEWVQELKNFEHRLYLHRETFD